MILTEDYISFEVAKPLVELHYIDSDRFYCKSVNPELPIGVPILANKIYMPNVAEKYPASTQALAIKFLRIKYNIEIVIFPERTEDMNKFYSYQIWRYETTPATGFTFNKQGDEYPSPKEAADSAILYCLQNLLKK